MKRKLLSFALVLAMVLAIFPVSAFATYDNGDFRYEIALRDTPEEKLCGDCTPERSQPDQC